MRRLTLLSFAFQLGAIPVAAQTAAAHMESLGAAPQPQTQTVIIQLPQQASACPVGVRARQAANWNKMEVGDEQPKGPAQRLHLTLVNPDSRRITGATVTVRGLTPKTRATPTPLTLGDDSSDAARTVDVPFSAGSGKEVSADLRVPGLSAVYSVDLVSVTYADGSNWKLTSGKSCRTSIDGVMLVGAR